MKYEFHITGDESILNHPILEGKKTITVRNLRPDGTVHKVEHMTAFTLSDHISDGVVEGMKAYATNLAMMLTVAGVEIHRVKIECPPVREFLSRAKYIETHFKSDDFKFPTSVVKTKNLATKRVYSDFEDFLSKTVVGDDTEICLYDTNTELDREWMELYADN